MQARPLFARSALAICLLANGCYHYRLSPANSAPADDGHSATKHAFVWGLLEQDSTRPNCQGNGVAEVDASTNLGYALLGVVTLGLWMPMEIEWKCAKDRLRVDNGLE